jgi:hypothetical protein
MRLGTILLMLGVAGIVTYAWLFVGTMQRAGLGEVKRYSVVFAARKKTNLLVAILVVGAFLIPVAWLAAGLLIAILGWSTYTTVGQRRRMYELNFNQSFTERLFRVSFLSPLAICCLLASKWWFAAYVA